MPNEIIFTNGKTKFNLENLSRIFLDIKRHTSKMLAQDIDICFSENPIVDIKAIAKNIGLDIIEVSPKKVDGKHALLDKNKKVIFLNEKDTNEEKRFSISHEIAHFDLEMPLTKTNEIYRSILDKEKELFKIHLQNNPQIAKKIADSGLDTKAEELAARLAIVNDEIVFEKNKKAISDEIARGVYKLIEKAVSNKKAYAFYEEKINAVYKKTSKAYIIRMINEKLTSDEYQQKLKTLYHDIENAIKEAIEKTCEEEIADYFAANLLVPTERFVLWEDRPDEEIAEVFEVNVECIQKRRKEIEYELCFMIPKTFLSDNVTIEIQSPGVI